ncbi:MAG: hypothetical protein C5B47_01260 [Verrucomicrobia bacterium]|nr:MAG: hypothetical protein C5B47_01260 [Verrucomicrobiota bacterium]
MQIAGKSDQNYFKALVVSIHDVHVGAVEGVEKILNDLQERGVTRVSLLVVPDYHRRGEKGGRRRQFLQWLKQQEALGREIVLHGYFHLYEPRGTTKGNLGQRWITQVYTAGEGEFYELDYESAKRKLKQGNETLGGGKIRGFIAPAWLLGREAERAVADAGFRYTVRLTSVVDFHSGKVHNAPTLAYSVRSFWRRRISLLWNPCLKFLSTTCPLLRISIHPPDWKFPAARAQILRLMTEALAVRTSMTYYEWISSPYRK